MVIIKEFPIHNLNNEGYKSYILYNLFNKSEIKWILFVSIIVKIIINN